MNDEREFLTLEQVEAMLPKGDRVHTFRSGGLMVIGADWKRDAIIKACGKYQPELAGPIATEMGHGIVLYDDHGPLFIETITDGETE